MDPFEQAIADRGSGTADPFAQAIEERTRQAVDPFAQAISERNGSQPSGLSDLWSFLTKANPVEAVARRVIGAPPQETADDAARILSRVGVPAAVGITGMLAAPAVGASILGQAGLGAGLSGGQRLLENVTQGKPTFEDVLPESLRGALFGGVGGTVARFPGPWQGLAGGVGAVEGNRAITNYEEGKPLTEGMTDPGGLAAGAAGGALGAIGGKILRGWETGLAKQSILEQYGQDAIDAATRVDAPLIDLPPVPQVMGELKQPTMVEPLTNWQKIRTDASEPARLLEDLGMSAAKVAAPRLQAIRSLPAQLTHRTSYNVEQALADVPEEMLPDVTRILRGAPEPEGGWNPVAQAAAQAMQERVYGPWANLLQRLGVQTKLSEGGFQDFLPKENYGGPLTMIDQNDGALTRLMKAFRGVRPTQRTAYQAKVDPLNVPEELQVMDPRQLAETYASKYGPIAAKAYAFGPIPEDTRYGNIGQALLDQLRADPSNRYQFAAEILKQNLDRIYATQDVNFGKGILPAANALVRSMLGGSWITQVGQAASPVKMYGLENTAEGIARFNKDPAFRLLTDVSGARDPGFYSTLEALPLHQQISPGWAIGKVESGLRGPMNAGFLPYLEDLATRAQAGEMTPAFLKQVNELRLTPGTLAGGLTPDIIRDAAQTSAERTQFVTGIGQVGPFWTDPIGRVISGLMTYPGKAANAALDDMIYPLLSGDPSLRRLGAGRIARLLLAAPVAEGARLGLHSLYTLQPPTVGDLGADVADTQLGYLANAGQLPVALYAASQGNRQPLYALTDKPKFSPAAFGPLSSIARNTLGSAEGDPAKMLRLAADLAAIRYPLAAFAKQPIYGLTRKER